MMKPLVAYLVSHPIPYQVPLFRSLAASQCIDFVALFGSNHGQGGAFEANFAQTVDFGVETMSGYDSVFLPGPARPSIDRFFGLRTPSIYSAWRRPKPDVMVLHGWRTAMLWQAALGAVRLDRPFMLRAETPRFTTVDTAMGLRRRLRNAGVQQLVRRASRLLSLGCANERFYEHMGASRQQLVRMPYFVDNEGARAAAEDGRRRRHVLRNSLGIPRDAVVVIAVGKLIERKRPADLLHALQGLPEAVHLLWVGSGPLMVHMRQSTDALRLGARVHWAGFKPSKDVWTLLGIADLFAIPSMEEPWGLVINEAVAAGLPVLASDACGAAENLITSGRTGAIVPAGDVQAWRAALGTWVARIARHDRGDRAEMARLAELHSVACAAAALEDAALASYARAVAA